MQLTEGPPLPCAMIAVQPNAQRSGVGVRRSGRAYFSTTYTNGTRARMELYESSVRVRARVQCVNSALRERPKGASAACGRRSRRSRSRRRDRNRFRLTHRRAANAPLVCQTRRECVAQSSAGAHLCVFLVLALLLSWHARSSAGPAISCASNRTPWLSSGLRIFIYIHAHIDI